MSKLSSTHVFTSESVSEGHPDKVCDQVSDAILDACLAADPGAHVACESMTTTNFLANAGEVKLRPGAWERVNPEAIARRVVREIGYSRPELLFSADTFEYVCRLHSQSSDIDQGVDATRNVEHEQGAGDQGMMFGYACSDTPERMPAPIMYAHRLLADLAAIRKSPKPSIPYLRPDSKAQVSIQYVGGKPRRITTVVISHQTDDVDIAVIRRDLERFGRETLGPTGLLDKDTRFYINPTGRFVIGGPHGDSGLTGRKIIVDTYGGVGSHGGGAFSGKDPSKVDRSAAYYARYAAKNIVAAGLAAKCEIQVAYAIGIARPLSINVDTYGTGKVKETAIQELLESGDLFDFRPAIICRDLGLGAPQGWSYQQTASYGHFGRDAFSWERTDKAGALARAFKV
jgi:S-adenosylmethionine synthetase